MSLGVETVVLDAGGRYGVHPTWKPFTGELTYYLFEPDPTEATRLRKKYKRRPHEIKVIDLALMDRSQEVKLSVFRNQAMSSQHSRHPISPSFKGERERQVEIVGHIDAQAVTADAFCQESDIELDFMKLDVEGSEYFVLQGARSQLSQSVLGIRCEVSFDRIFENMPLFSTIHAFMLAQGFYLLNLSYDGRGDYCNEFVALNGKYGILTACDAVWLKRREHLFSQIGPATGTPAVPVLKYAAFCLLNDASDVAVDVLLEAKREYRIDFHNLKRTRLYQFVDISLSKLFYGLKWQPGQSLETHKRVYHEIFNKRMKEMHEYNQSLKLNPD